MKDYILFIPLYVLILALTAGFAYFLWKSRKIQQEALETVSMLDMIEETTGNAIKSISKDIKKELKEALKPETIGGGLLEYIIAVINDEEMMKDIMPHFQPLADRGLPMPMSVEDAEDVNNATGQAMLNYIHGNFGLVGAKALEMSFGDEWEKTVLEKPQKAMGVINNLKEFGVFDLVEGLKAKIRPDKIIKNAMTTSAPENGKKSIYG